MEFGLPGQLKNGSLMYSNSLRIVLLALALSLLGHLILFFGIPFLSFASAPQIADDLIIRTELKLEPPKKIQMAKAVKKKISKENSSNKAEDAKKISGTK